MKLKNRKLHGINNIPNELMKYGGSEIAQDTLKLLQKTLGHERMEKSITIAYLYSKDSKDLSNYGEYCVILLQLVENKPCSEAGIW